MNWTDDQKKVIETRGKSILVSAAAGSGKTAVLVERIMGLITDAEHPADIDDLLIVTFTRAAAGEMKARISRALTEARERDPDNEHLARQMLLIHHAEITTIDGFCAGIVREYGHLTGVTPGFRIGGEGEVRLLKKDIARDVVEEAYGREGEKLLAFTDFSEMFATGKNDTVLDDMILRVYEAAVSNPDPDVWLNGCRSKDDKSENGEPVWMQYYLEGIRRKTGLIRIYAKENLDIALREDGPSSYQDVARADYDAVVLCETASGYRELRDAAASYVPKRLPGGKAKPDETPGLRDRFRKNREKIKSALNSLREELCIEESGRMEEYGRRCGEALDVLIDLVFRFREMFTEAKRRKNMMDFSDVEHEALGILVTEGGQSPAAALLAGRYREVMVDEYQDSNYLQEAILTSVTGILSGVHNYFTVGDVKQSIYSFRQARPELFLAKYKEYREDAEKGGVRIDLHKNFRSRGEVISTVNAIFRMIMHAESGGIEYDEDAALTEGASYPPGDGFETELMPVFTGEKDDEGEAVMEDTGASAAAELEARAIGDRILRLLDEQQIWDKKEKRMRNVRCKDIVILMRSVKGVADGVVRILGSMGIPAYSEVRTGYFDAPEVQTLLSFLEILDNPRQDIPLAAVLLSPWPGFTPEELAVITARGRAKVPEKQQPSLYDVLLSAAGDDDEIARRAERFLQFYGEKRESLPYTPLHELISSLLSETGYLDYAAALPNGAQRELNLKMLVDQAADYESTSYTGLFHFVRYIRNLEKQEADPGEASLLSGNEDVVRVLSIHKSKGLEYPVVFVAGLGRKFNMGSLTEKPLIHQDLGLASDYVDPDRRLRIPTLKKYAVAARIREDQLSEEMRILYVAMTRAEQKLILSGCIKDEETLRDRSLLTGADRERLPAGYVMSAGCFFDWILPAANVILAEDARCGRKPFLLECPVKPSYLASHEVGNAVTREAEIEELRLLKRGMVFDPGMKKLMDERFFFRYPYEGRENIPVEMSVSEIKRRGMEEPESDYAREEAEELFKPLEPEQRTVPRFIREREGRRQQEMPSAEPEAASADGETASRVTGAALGTAFHRAMELYDYGRLKGSEPDHIACAEEQLREFAESGCMTREEAEAVRTEWIAAFTKSSLGKRMRAAAERGSLKREQPFVMAVSASDIDPEWPDDEEIFVQGIIDAFFAEGDKLVLVDYKTDRVSDEAELLKRYRIQLKTYAEALTRTNRMPVGEMLIWSAALKKEIEVRREE